MEFLVWLEEASIAEWARVSLWGYPITITAHSIGLAVMVGPALMLNLRLLGLFKSIPYQSFSRILSFAWFGFAMNFLSGLVLFSMQATSYVTNTVFITKITLVLVGAIISAQQQSVISRNSASWSATGTPVSVTLVAIVSLVAWMGAIIAGRLIAYLS